MLESYPNLCCDLSAGSALNALSRDQEYSRALLTRFADRFTFARDCFDGRMAAHLDSLELPGDVREAIFHGNAERLVPDAS
jgi:predicted TIM-barrel fold metal-dependent hydrolase